MGEILKQLPQIFIDVAKEHGEFIGLSVVVLLFFGWLTVSLIRKIIKTKNDEIERLVAIRDRLLDEVLDKRVSSQPTPLEIKENKEKQIK